MVDRRFLLQVGFTVVLAAGLGFVMFPTGTSDEAFVGAAVGLALSVLNAVAGTLSLAYAFDKSHTRFMVIVFLGMLARMGLLLAGLLVLIKLAGLHVLSLSVSLFGFYLIFLIMEILSLQRLAGRRSA